MKPKINRAHRRRFLDLMRKRVRSKFFDNIQMKMGFEGEFRVKYKNKDIVKGNIRGDNLYINKLEINPSIEGLGLGTRVMREIIRKCREEYFLDSITLSSISTASDYKKRTLRLFNFYLRLGFRPYSLDNMELERRLQEHREIPMILKL